MNIINVLRLAYFAFIAFLGTSLEEGASFGVEAFLIPSILMGAGIAIDVLITTLAKFQDDHVSWHNWTVPITLTHTFFPAFGYFLFWSLDDAFPFAHTFLGLAGFTLVALYVYEVLSEAIGKKPVFGISAWIGKKFGVTTASAGAFVAVLAVSWDALWSGPARAAQASAAGWGGIEVFLSFVIAGVVVAIVAELALTLTRSLRRRNYRNYATITNLSILGTYLELSVIGGFGILSLWDAFVLGANLYASIAIMAILLLFFFIPKYQTMRYATT
jgi:hypothetical protein